jgi:hypothetical protein
VGQVRLTTRRVNQDPSTSGPPALALSAAGRYRLNEQMMLRLSAGSYFGVRGVPNQEYSLALSSHATVRVGVELAFWSATPPCCWVGLRYLNLSFLSHPVEPWQFVQKTRGSELAC